MVRSLTSRLSRRELKDLTNAKSQSIHYGYLKYNDEIIDEDSLLMIFASYVSDRKADSSSSGSSSSNRSSN